MDKAEFDKFAEEYQQLHAQNIKASGEDPDFFAEYKIRDTARFLSKTNEIRSARILDFGSGVGNSIPYFRKYLPQYELTCLDVSQKSLAFAEARFPDMARFVGFDGSHIPFENGHFDVIFSACVFHHVDSAEHAGILREMQRTLRLGGWLIIFEHNPWNPLTVHAVNTCPFDENAVLVPAPTLQHRIRDAGFAAPRRHYCMFFPKSLRSLRRAEPWLEWLPLGAQYYITARKS